MATKPLYQPWNHEEFNADRKVRNMGSAARKCYMALLHEAFFCSTRPCLPDDDNELYVLADCDSMEEWIAVSDKVRPMFLQITVDGTKLLKNKRVSQDWDRVQAVKDKNRANALNRWNTAASDSAESSATVSGSNATAMQSHTHLAEGDATAIQVSKEVSKEVNNKSIVEDFTLDGAPAGSSSNKEGDIKSLVKSGWSYFLDQTGRHADQYKLTPDRLTMGRRGFESLIAFAKSRGAPDPHRSAEELFRCAVDRLVSSPFHAGKNDQGRPYLDWHQLFTGKGHPAPRKLLEFWLDDNRWPA